MYEAKSFSAGNDREIHILTQDSFFRYEFATEAQCERVCAVLNSQEWYTDLNGPIWDDHYLTPRLWEAGEESKGAGFWMSDGELALFGIPLCIPGNVEDFLRGLPVEMIPNYEDSLDAFGIRLDGYNRVREAMKLTEEDLKEIHS